MECYIFALNKSRSDLCDFGWHTCLKHQLSLVVVVVTRPLPRDGGVAEDHGAPETGQIPRAWTRGRKETQSCERVSNAKGPLLDSAE